MVRVINQNLENTSGEHTFESANAKMQELGNRIVESTFNGWGKPCTIIFADGTESTKHSPYEVDYRGLKSKPKHRANPIHL